MKTKIQKVEYKSGVIQYSTTIPGQIIKLAKWKKQQRLHWLLKKNGEVTITPNRNEG